MVLHNVFHHWTMPEMISSEKHSSLLLYVTTYMVSGENTVVEHKPHHHKVEYSSPASAAGTGKEKMQAILKGKVSLYR